jgi:hypothetical protein
MMKTIDIGQLRSMTLGPGSDSQQWVGYVLLTSDPSVEEGGIFFDGIVQPTGEPTTVRLSPTYVAAGGTVYFPATKGDLLVCAFPEGTPGSGAVEIARLPSRVDTVPGEVQQKPLDLWIFASPGTTCRIRATGGVLELKADLISLTTTGSAETSKVFIDGVNWNHILQTPVGPTVGAPTSNPTNPNYTAELEWLSGGGGI